MAEISGVVRKLSCGDYSEELLKQIRSIDLNITFV